MRQGLRDNGWLLDDAGAVIAVSLGTDFCAEHEWGIKETRRAFGMTDDGYGIDRRRVRAAPKTLVWHEGKVSAYRDRRFANEKCAGLWLARYDFAIKDGPHMEHGLHGDQTLWTGWSDGDFGAFSTDADERTRLRDLFDALGRLDACIWGGGGVFQNAGLVVAIASRIPAERLEAWDKHDREHGKLTADAKATGIEERLRKAKKEWFALVPKRCDDGSIRFWLNPVHQRTNNSGWYTVADLDAWIAGKGPVVEKRRGA